MLYVWPLHLTLKYLPLKLSTFLWRVFFTLGLCRREVFEAQIFAEYQVFGLPPLIMWQL